MSKSGLAVSVCLLLAGAVLAAQSGFTAKTALDGMSTIEPSEPGGNDPSTPLTSLENDVGVSALTPTIDVYVTIGGAVFPSCAIKNYGTQTQSEVPVVCVVYDTAAGTMVYGPETVYVASIKPGIVLNVQFPPWVPPREEKVYLDTVRTALPGDELPTNDWQAGRLSVAGSDEGRLTYNDGSFENGLSWVGPHGELTVVFSPPLSAATIDKAVLWVSSRTGSDYDAEVRVRANDGSPHGIPGTQLGAWVGKLQTDTWPMLYRNEVQFDPPVTMDSDTFFVSYYQTTVYPAYPFLGIDCSPPVTRGNDWIWRTEFGRWSYSDYDIFADFGVDVYYTAVLRDGSPKAIVSPGDWVDSTLTFYPQILVRNCGLEDCGNIPARFYIIEDSYFGDTVYAAAATSGPVKSGQTAVVTFTDPAKLPSGNYAMVGVSQLPLDSRPSNDVFARPLTVGRSGVAARDVTYGPILFGITPNPVQRIATVSYCLPRAGRLALGVYDATGRMALSQSIVAGRAGATRIDLRSLRAGVYIVRAAADGFSATQKVVVER